MAFGQTKKENENENKKPYAYLPGYMPAYWETRREKSDFHFTKVLLTERIIRGPHLFS
jgi:hypothetical protein